MVEKIEKRKVNSEVKRMVLTAIFAALAIVVGYIEIPWFPPLSFLKLDFSEVVILTSLITLGFNRTLVVIVLRSGVRWLISSGNTDIPFPFFGELLAITASIVIISSAVLAFKVTRSSQTPLFLTDKKDRKLETIPPLKQFIHMLLVIVIFTTFMTLLNAFITFPAMLSGGKYYLVTQAFSAGFKDPFGWFSSVGSYLRIMGLFVATFNIVKGALTMTVFSLLHNRIAQLEV